MKEPKCRTFDTIVVQFVKEDVKVSKALDKYLLRFTLIYFWAILSTNPSVSNP